VDRPEYAAQVLRMSLGWLALSGDGIAAPATFTASAAGRIDPALKLRRGLSPP